MYANQIPELTNAELADVKEKALEKLGVCKLQNDIIGKQVFSILSRYARVIYYPFGKDEIWGFTRVTGLNKETQNDKPFVAINSSIPSDCQIFAAAHELYHIWFENTVDIIPANIINEECNDRNELKANRFAAEFLVDEELLHKQLSIYFNDSIEIGLREILKLSDIFSVPYRTMVKRLYEIRILTMQKCSDYLNITEDDLVVARKRYSFLIPEADNRIAIDNLTDLAVNAYEKGYITFEKLEYLLSFSDLIPSDVGMAKHSSNAFPSDSELDAIMEE